MARKSRQLTFLYCMRSISLSLSLSLSFFATAVWFRSLYAAHHTIFLCPSPAAGGCLGVAAGCAVPHTDEGLIGDSTRFLSCLDVALYASSGFLSFSLIVV